jgi:pimeloyl-ACP methyl ester carboxylesterase
MPTDANRSTTSTVDRRPVERRWPTSGHVHTAGRRPVQRERLSARRATPLRPWFEAERRQTHRRHMAADGRDATSHIAQLSDGRSLAYSDVGPSDGVPIVLCHGLPASRLVPEFHKPLLEELAIRMIVPDRPGVGLSDFKPARTVLDSTDDIAELADLLGLDRFRVLGVSSGAAYALACCAAFPKRILGAGIATGITPLDRAGILRTAVPRPVYWAARRSRLISRGLYALLASGMRHSPTRALKALGQSLAADDQRLLARQNVADYLRAAMLEAGHVNARGIAYDDWLLNRPWGFSPGSVPASVPVHLWWGAEDTAVPLAHACLLAKRIPHATAHVIERSGHFGVSMEHLRRVLVELCQRPDCG